MLIPVDYAQANIVFTGVNLPEGAETTLGLNIEVWTGTTPADLADCVVNAWVDALMPGMFVDEMVLSAVNVKFGPNDTGADGGGTYSVVGGDGGSAVPPNTSLLVKKQTGFGGRTGRGRMFIPGLPETQVTDAGTVSSTWVSDLTTRLEDFRTSTEWFGAVPTLLHSPDSPVLVPMPIVALVPDNKVATQRRRLRR